MESIGVVLASMREGRRGEAFAKWIHGILAEREGVAASLIDLKDWLLPPYTSAQHPLVADKTLSDDSPVGRWSKLVRGFDGFVVVTPEYNTGYPGQLKNAFDHVNAPWNYKPIGFVSYGGVSSGTRAVQQLRQVAIELRMVPIRDEVPLTLIGLATDERGFPTAELYVKRANAMADELVWWTRLLKDGRERHPR
jgi:NAD(P)H-dependent FMN reductase